MTDTTVRERGIVMDGEEVRGLIAGTKTQHRLPIVPQPPNGYYYDPINYGGEREPAHGWSPKDWSQRVSGVDSRWPRKGRLPCPFGRVGDRLYVRETWCEFQEPDWIGYKADGRMYRFDTVEDTMTPRIVEQDAMVADPPRWKSPMHMPRWASRLMLEISEIHVQRVQEISEEDAIAEGYGPGFVACPHPEFGDVMTTRCVGHRPLFIRRWDDRHARRGYPFESNPWVWALSLRRVDDD